MYARKLKQCGLLGIGLGLILVIGNIFSSQASNEDDKIHFINIGNSDAILVESNNKFALIDTGKNNETEEVEHEKVLNYLKKVAKNEKGNIELDCIIATHPTEKSIGGLSEIIKNKDVEVKRIVLENYEDSTKRVRSLEEEANRQAYYDLINTVSEKNIFRITNPNSATYSIGDFSLEFINTLESKESIQFLDDSNSSMAVKVTKGNKSALLTGGLNNNYMDETRVASDVGDVDLMVLANQGNKSSSSEPFLNMVSPEKCILLGENQNLYPTTYSVLKNMKSEIYTTQDNGDIIATFTDEDIHINKNKKMVNGWYQDFHRKYYYNENGEFLTGWQNIEGSTYLFGEDGSAHVGWITDNDGNTYFANNDGVIQKGLTRINVQGQDKTYYFNENGVLATGWIAIEDKWYYFDENIESENYATPVTGMVNIFYNDAERTFMFDESGVMQTGLVQVEDKFYYFNNNPEIGVVGEMLKGAHQLIINDVDGLYDFGEDGVLKNI